MARYHWSSAHDWLFDYMNDSERGVDTLRMIIRELATRLDSDTIQDSFYPEMGDAGYFVDLDAATLGELTEYPALEHETAGLPDTPPVE